MESRQLPAVPRLPIAANRPAMPVPVLWVSVTYLQFLGVFVIPPILALLLVLRKRRHSLPWVAVGLLCLVALTYTTPWDNLILLNGVWSYPPQRVTGVKLGLVPIEEYGFFVLQTVLTSLFTL